MEPTTHLETINLKDTREKKLSKFSKLKRDKWLYLLLLPGILYFIVFKFGCYSSIDFSTRFTKW